MTFAESQQALTHILVSRNARNDEGHHRFAKNRVGVPHDRNFRQIPAFHQSVLNLATADPLSTALEKVVGTINDVQETIFIDSGDVARVELAIAKSSRRCLRLSPVAPRNALAFGNNLSRLPGAYVSARAVQNLKRHSGDSPSD